MVPLSSRAKSNLNLALILLITFATAVEYSLLMPTVWHYLQHQLHVTNEIWLGIAVAIFSVARTLFFPVIGAWADRRGFREPYAVCCVIGLAGSFAYGVAGQVLGGSIWLAILGRFVAGVGAARVTLSSTYVARTVVPSERTKWMGILIGAQMLFNMVGPAVNFAFIHLDYQYGWLDLSADTVAGYLPALINTVLFVVVCTLFTEVEEIKHAEALLDARIAPADAGSQAATLPEQAATEAAEASMEPTVVPIIFEDRRAGATSADGAGAVDAARVELVPPPSHSKPATGCAGWWARHRLVFVERSGWFVLLVNFITGFEISALETISTPLTKQFGWGVLENSALYGGISLVALLSVVLSALAKYTDKNGPQEQRTRPRKLILCGFSFYGAAFVVALTFCTPDAFPYIYMLLFGALFVTGIPLSISPTMAVYSSQVPDERKGEYLGMASLVQGVGRISGPLVASGAFYASRGAGHWPLFICMLLVYVAGPIAMLFVWSKFKLNLSG